MHGETWTGSRSSGAEIRVFLPEPGVSKVWVEEEKTRGGEMEKVLVCNSSAIF